MISNRNKEGLSKIVERLLLKGYEERWKYKSNVYLIYLILNTNS